MVDSRRQSSAAMAGIVSLALLALLASHCAAETNTEAVNPSRVDGVVASMPACSTALADWDGTVAYSNGVHTGTGVSCAGEGGRYGYEYQCVELVMRHFQTHWGFSWRGNARDLLTNAPRAQVDVYTNGDGAHPPVPGDLLVWQTGTWGHTALITAVRSDAIEILEQNVIGPGIATLGYDGSTIAARWGGWIPAGWAHAHANQATSSAAHRGRTADVDGDGFADLVTVHSSGTGYVYRGGPTASFSEGVGSFSGSLRTALFDGAGHDVIAVADVDGDGAADLVTSGPGSSAYVFRGGRSAQFGDAVVSFAGTFASAMHGGAGHETIAVADVNGDGRADLVTAHSSGTVWVFPGRPDATFGDGVTSFGGTFDSALFDRVGHYAVGVADVTGDARADLVTVHSGGVAYVFPGQRDGRFGDAVPSFDGTMRLGVFGGGGHEPIGVSDVDGDGRADLITQQAGTVFVFRGQPDGSLTDAVANFGGTMASSLFGSAGHEIIAALDINGDARADLVTAHSNGNVYVYPGLDDGRFGDAVLSFGGTFASVRGTRAGHEAASEGRSLRRRGCPASGCL